MRDGSENICHCDFDISDILSKIGQARKLKPGPFIAHRAEVPWWKSLPATMLGDGLG